MCHFHQVMSHIVIWQNYRIWLESFSAPKWLIEPLVLRSCPEKLIFSPGKSPFKLCLSWTTFGRAPVTRNWKLMRLQLIHRETGKPRISWSCPLTPCIISTFKERRLPRKSGANWKRLMKTMDWPEGLGWQRNWLRPRHERSGSMESYVNQIMTTAHGFEVNETWVAMFLLVGRWPGCWKMNEWRPLAILWRPNCWGKEENCLVLKWLCTLKKNTGKWG